MEETKGAGAGAGAGGAGGQVRDDGPRYDIRQWSDKQLSKQLTHAVARLLHADIRAVRKYVLHMAATGGA